MKNPENSTASNKLAGGAIAISPATVFVGLAVGFLLSMHVRASAIPDNGTSIEIPQGQAFTEQNSPADYLSEMGRKIKKSWSPSDDEGRQQTMVGFTIAQDGSISNLKILRSSSNEAYDKRALQAVLEASPFEHLPESTEKIDVQFSFDNKRTSHAPPTRAEIGVTESDLIWLPSLAR
jgi:TonB family protein